MSDSFAIKAALVLIIGGFIASSMLHNRVVKLEHRVIALERDRLKDGSLQWSAEWWHSGTNSVALLEDAPTVGIATTNIALVAVRRSTNGAVSMRFFPGKVVR